MLPTNCSFAKMKDNFSLYNNLIGNLYPNVSLDNSIIEDEMK